MTAKITVLRGPVLSNANHSQFEGISLTPVYIKDAFIILDENKIIDFGPSNQLQSQLPENVLVTKYNQCRIIKSTMCA